MLSMTAQSYPVAIDPELVGTYPALAKAGGGLVWDADGGGIVQASDEVTAALQHHRWVRRRRDCDSQRVPSRFKPDWFSVSRRRNGIPHTIDRSLSFGSTGDRRRILVHESGSGSAGASADWT